MSIVNYTVLDEALLLDVNFRKYEDNYMYLYSSKKL